MSSERVEFRTFDGTMLKGDWYKSQAKVAFIIVMTQGLSFLKEHFVDEFAKRFPAAGISALAYDHQGWGSSEGTPQFETSPLQQAIDYHNAITFASSLQRTNQKPRIAIWGIGYSGGASMIAGNDPRLSAVILVMPFTSKYRANTAAARIAGQELTIEYVTLWADSKESALGKGPQKFLTGIDAYNFITSARQRSNAVGTQSANKLTLQSFYHIANIEPVDYIHKIALRALLYLAASTDAISDPLGIHEKAFALAGEPKEFVVLRSHHLANYFGEYFEENVQKQINFLKKYF